MNPQPGHADQAEGALYCVIDCAADPRLFATVRQTSRAMPLFAGALDPELAAATPHLVPVEAEAPLLKLIASPEGRSRAFGCAVRAHIGPQTLWRHLRRHMLVRLPHGEVVMFRFFDPRVMGPYLDSLTPEELAPWFDGITDWWLPGPGQTSHYAWQGGGMVRTALPA